MLNCGNLAVSYKSTIIVRVVRQKYENRKLAYSFLLHPCLGLRYRILAFVIKQIPEKDQIRLKLKNNTMETAIPSTLAFFSVSSVFTRPRFFADPMAE